MWRTLLRALVDKGADVNALNADEETLLFDLIAKNGSELEMVRLLLERGADRTINILNNVIGYTCMHLAAPMGMKNVIKILMEYGVYIDAINRVSRTPIELAALADNESTMDWLFDHGAVLKTVADVQTIPDMAGLSLRTNNRRHT